MKYISEFSRKTKKHLPVILMLFSFISTNAQTRFFTKNGKIIFDATSASSPEKIAATNEKATSVIDISTGAMEFAVLMKAFSFEKALMEEHFNENYVESDKFPKAVFKGTILNMKEVNLQKDGVYTVHIKGTMTMHGVSKEIGSDGKMTVKAGLINGAKSEFTILLSDFGITIPSLVKDKVASEAKISVDVVYEPLKAS